MNKIIVLMCFIWVMQGAAFDMLIIKNYCRDYWFPVLMLSLTLFAFKTSSCAQQTSSNNSFHQKTEATFKESVKSIIYTSANDVKNAFANAFNNKPIDLRIRCNQSIIQSYSFSRTLIEHQPFFASCLVPTNLHSNEQHYDIDLGYVLQASIKKVLKLVTNIANAKNIHQRNTLYSKLEKKIKAHKISTLQALEYQIILNTLCLQCNIDNKSDQLDLIPAILSDKSYSQEVSSDHQEFLDHVIHSSRSLQAEISVFFRNEKR